ncbi:MAG: hypothetical protein JWM27_396 [Gemmatimonadetes bacterium]|nr:hypothetical protein [Gemmatimonadota bacterium]
MTPTAAASTGPVSADLLAALPRYGVGVLYNAALPGFLEDSWEELDYLAVIPDRFWTDEGEGQVPRYTPVEAPTDLLDRVARRLPIVGHSVGLSIGSAEMFDDEHVRQIADWQRRYRMAWHSDHLSFLRVKGLDAHSQLAGLPIPVPYDHEVLDLLAQRVEQVQRAVPVPFLLENNVYYVDLPDQDMTEPEFLNRLMHRTGCGLLLDVHNVHCNATNHGFDPREFIHALDLTRVVEVHIAGGSDMAGMYTDSHAGPVAEPVWELLDDVVAHAPNLCAVTFEFDESYFPALKSAGVRAELRHAREVWERHH